MAGYDGFKKSNNAILAEENGLMNASNSAKYLKKLGVKGISAAIINENLKSDEEHHTSCHYNLTSYFSKENLLKNRNLLRRKIAEKRAGGYWKLNFFGYDSLRFYFLTK